jgi:hypothetical protein
MRKCVIIWKDSVVGSSSRVLWETPFGIITILPCTVFMTLVKEFKLL